jgi:hypothetical protein
MLAHATHGYQETQERERSTNPGRTGDVLGEEVKAKE